MIRRTLSKELLNKEPWQLWNSYVNLLAMEEYADLNPTQKVASALFNYGNEVENGGHMQYFANHGIPHLQETIKALEAVGGTHFLAFLRGAQQICSELDLENIDDVEAYIEIALDDHFGEFDAKFYECEPSIIQILEHYLEEHQDAFIELV